LEAIFGPQISRNLAITALPACNFLHKSAPRWQARTFGFGESAGFPQSHGLIGEQKRCPCAPFRQWKHAVIYKGVEYTVVATAEPDIWEWRYQIGDKVKTGRTQTRLAALAARRVQSKIDAALRVAKSSPPNPDR
jgi:hypothetical protein